jgi:hypothetical protein
MKKNIDLICPCESRLVQHEGQNISGILYMRTCRKLKLEVKGGMQVTDGHR